MGEQAFLDSLEDLTGRVVIVTGGAAGIGLDTTVFLAQKGATVYVASRNKEKSERGIATARERLKGQGGPIKFHHLDLASIADAKKSAEDFLKRESRLDILVCNAGIGMVYLNELSKEGYERSFAVNHLGHFAFVTTLLDLIENTASTHGDARIVVTSSIGQRIGRKLDYVSLETRIDTDGKTFVDMFRAFGRYCDTKLANVYFTAELDKRLRERGVRNVYCNSCHPGTATYTGLTNTDVHPVGGLFETMVRASINPFSNTTADAAKTQVYLAASKDVKESGVSGKYWEPVFSWMNAYKSCKVASLGALAQDQQEQEKLWLYSEEAVKKAAG
ncbi:MAG: hypothetical protein M1832_000008 [Thelocarpon impressellum]|nr:MAG: hypothetical protein M1832_000008 [Thelocarpon impressellum]